MKPVDSDDHSTRRPQWRGERQALLVRVPVGLAAQVRAEAGRSRRSLSDTAAALIQAGLDEGVTASIMTTAGLSSGMTTAGADRAGNADQGVA